MADLVERLRGYRPQNEWGDDVEHAICNEAAAEIERLRATLNESQDMHLSALRRNCTLRDALVKISSPTQTEGLLWWQVEARAALDAPETSGAYPARRAALEKETRDG